MELRFAKRPPTKGVAMTDGPPTGPRVGQAPHAARPGIDDPEGFPAPPGLIEEATRKAGLIWISAPADPHPRPAWHHWHEGSAYVLTGGSEEPLSWLVETRSAQVSVPSKDSGGRLITWQAEVTWIPPTTDEWHRVIDELGVARLNSRDSGDQQSHWARDCDLVRLTPTGSVTEAPGRMSEESGAAPPPPSPATTSGPLPFVVGRGLRTRAQMLARLRPRRPRR